MMKVAFQIKQEETQNLPGGCFKEQTDAKRNYQFVQIHSALSVGRTEFTHINVTQKKL